tara:strand:- start:11760 stop:17012 length:5253 start_codon:yes stop_codon:yes gene_type:complete
LKILRDNAAQLIDKAFDISRKNLNLRLNRLKPKQMKKLYSYLLAGLAVLMVSGLSAQVTGITVTNTAPCPGESVTISWDIGSDGGTPFNVSIVGSDASVVSAVTSDVYANTLDFTAVDGVTYTTFINGNNGTATGVAPIVTNESPSIPTGFTIDGAAATKVCSGAAFDLATTGEDLGTSGTIEWYANDETTALNSGNPYNVAAGIVATTTYKVRVEDAVCGNNTAFFPVTVDVFTAPSVAATSIAFDGTTYTGAVCPGTYTLTAVDGNGGDNPATDTIFYSEGTFTTVYAGDAITLGSNATADVYVEFVDGCAVAPVVQSGQIAVASKTASTAPVSVTTSVGGPVCSGASVTYTANGAIEGTGFTYEYQVNGAGAWIADADGVIALNITEATSVAFRLKDDCNTVGTAVTASPSVAVFTASTDVTAVSHTAGADNEICAGSSVTFTANGALGTSGGTQFEVQITENGAVTAWAPTANPLVASHTMNITALGTGTVVEFRVNDGCTGTGAEVSSATVNVAADNVAPTTLTAAATTCGTENVLFTSDGTLGGNGAVFQFSTDIAFGTILQSGTTNTYTHSVSSDLTMYVRILGGCNDVSGLTPSAAVDFQAANVAPTTLTPSVTSVCDPANVTFTVDGTLGDGATVFEFSEDGFGSVSQSSAANTYTTNVTADVTVSARIAGGCNPIPGTVVTATVDFNAPSVDPTAAENDAPAGISCGVNTYIFKPTGFTLGDNAIIQYRVRTDDGNNTVLVPWTATTNQTTGEQSISVTEDIKVSFRITGDCDGNGPAKTTTVDYQEPNVAPTMVSASQPTTCGTESVTFTMDGSVGDGAVYEFSTDGFGTTAQTGASNSYTFNVSADVTVSARISNGCNDVSPTVVTTSVDYLAPNVAPTMVSASQATTCGTESVTFTMDGTVGDGAVYEFSTDGFASTAQTGALNTYTFNVSADVTVSARINLGCNDVSPTVVTTSVDYVEPTDVASIIVKSEYGEIGSLAPVTVTPICIGDDAYVSVSNYTIGDGATLQYSIDAGGSWANVVADTVKILDIQVTTTVYFQVIGSCNVPAAIPSSTINVYPAIPEVTSLTIDKDNLCANDGEVVRLTAFTTVPVATPYVYEWSKYKASNNTYSVIGGAPNAAIYDVTPDTITAYSVRIIGCNDTSAYVTQLVTVKDTSSVAGAIVVTNAGVDDKVCAGSLVTYNLSGGKKGYDAQLFWYNDNDVLVGQGNPFIMNVTQDTTLYAKYIGECNTTVNSVSKTIEVYEQSDVNMEITAAADTAQCVGSMADLVALTTTTPVGGNFSGANVVGNVLDVQLGMNVFTYTFDFGGCNFSVNDTIYGIAAPIAAVLADSTLSNTCAGAVNVGAFQVDDVNNEGLTFAVPTVGSYITTPADTVAEFTGLAAGNYTIEVTNSIGCITNLAVEIISEGGLSAKIDTANSSFIVCNGAATGMLTVVADSGVAPYEYSFVDGAPSYSSKNDTTGLDGSEVFDVIVKDASGCEFTVASNVSIISNVNNASLTLKNIVEPTCYDALDGRFDAVATGGFGPYMYSLDGVNFKSESRFDNLSVDVYTVTVRNTVVFAGNNVPGCPRNFISPLLGPDSLSVVQSIVSGDPINGYEVLFTIAGGNGGYEISINGGDFGTTFQLSQSSGAYNYVVRDVNGCTKSGSYVLDGVDGVNDINDVVTSVYPNPFTNTLTLVGTDMVNAEVVFTDINGKVLVVEMESSNDKVVISTSDVASGIYLVKVVTNNGSTVKRVIKN